MTLQPGELLYPLNTGMVHFWTTFLKLREKGLAIIFQKNESRSKIVNKITSQKIIFVESCYFYHF